MDAKDRKTDHSAGMSGFYKKFLGEFFARLDKQTGQVVGKRVNWKM